MKKYETVFIIGSKESEDSRRNVLEKIENYIKENGELESVEDMGLKKLAYEIRKNKEGYYYLIKFKMEPCNISELERIYRIIDEIIKFIVVKIDV